MTTPTLALGQTALEGQTVQPDDLVLHSVTKVIGALDKPALIWWSGDETAKAAIAAADTLAARLKAEGNDEVYQWLRRARFRANAGQLASAPLGTAFHSLAEQYALQGTRPTADDVAAEVRRGGLTQADAITGESSVLSAMLDQFDGWLQRFSPSYQATEVCVYSPTYGVAGTCDGFLTIDGTRFIFDTKTSRQQFDSRGAQKGPYPEVALQLAAYRYSELAAVWRPRRAERYKTRYYLLSPAEQAMAQPVPEVDAALCIYVTPGSCESHPIRADETVHRSFLHVLEAYRWVQDLAPTVVGDALEVAS